MSARRRVRTCKTEGRWISKVHEGIMSQPQEKTGERDVIFPFILQKKQATRIVVLSFKLGLSAKLDKVQLK